MNLNSSIIRIIERTLNCVDPRLMNHGRRVAYLSYRVHKRRGLDTASLENITLLTLLHDIGAYKTEEIDDMFRFEKEGIWEHSIYGYLFIKFFSPLADIAPAVLFHHAGCPDLTYLAPEFHDYAQVMHIADRFDILSRADRINSKQFSDHFNTRQGKSFRPDLLEFFGEQSPENVFAEMATDEGFYAILYNEFLSSEQVEAFLKMIVLAIDFRSPQTVTHTFTTAKAGKVMANMIGIEGKRADSIYMGILLHDIGKIGIPYDIIEKPGKLTGSEMQVMKNHVAITEDILAGTIDKDIIDIAVRHHEKLDGSGYPRGLKANELSMEERAVAVADIFSALCTPRSYKEAFPKDKVVGILAGMSAEGLLDERIVGLAIDNYDMLMDEIKKTTVPIAQIYEKLRAEYEELLEKIASLRDIKGGGLIPLRGLRLEKINS